jgi:hypothetical protein
MLRAREFFPDILNSSFAKVMKIALTLSMVLVLSWTLPRRLPIISPICMESEIKPTAVPAGPKIPAVPAQTAFPAVLGSTRMVFRKETSEGRRTGMCEILYRPCGTCGRWARLVA